MASNELFDTGIKVTGSFSAAGAFPVDGKYIVNTIEERDDHVTQNRAYDGMQVYVKADGLTYQYHLATNSWSVFHDDKMYSHAVTNKGIASGESGEGGTISPGLYKIITNQEGHVVSVEKVTKEDIKALGVAITDTTYTVGGDTLGLVKNGGNVVINKDGTMTAPESTGTASQLVASYDETTWDALDEGYSSGKIISVVAENADTQITLIGTLVTKSASKFVFSTLTADGVYQYICDKTEGWSATYRSFIIDDTSGSILTDNSGNILVDIHGATIVSNNVQ